MFKCVLFDFDGTVFDTVEGITKSIRYTINKHGMDAPLDELLKLCRRDKKSTVKDINLVLLHRIGEAYTHKIPVDDLEAFFGV